MPGIVPSNLSDRSMLRVNPQHVLLPLAAAPTVYSATTAGGASAAIPFTTVATNLTINLSAYALRCAGRTARLPTVTVTDAAFVAPLVANVRIIGKRFGKIVSQVITATSSSAAAFTVAGTRCLDEIISMTVLTSSGNAASDTISVGFDGARLGLTAPIKNVRSVKFVEKIISGAPNASTGATTGTLAAADGPKALAVIQQPNIVFPIDSSVDVSALFNNVAIANTDRFYFEFLGDGFQDEFERSPEGKKFN